VKNVLGLCAAVAIGCFLQGTPSRAQTAATADAPSPVNGKAVYMRAGCFTCHGTVGHGGAGARLTPNPPPIAAFTSWVRKGTPGWSVLGGMPAFSPALISDKELADIRAYLASLPPPPAAKDIPLLQ
jgi:ubiquinol-cytochrome c reductase cytochrome c subunit